MRLMLVMTAGAVLAACTPRDNRDADLELQRAPEEAVHAEPTVVGGAYDSIIYRVNRERGVEMDHGHGDAHDAAEPPSAEPPSAERPAPSPEPALEPRRQH